MITTENTNKVSMVVPCYNKESFIDDMFQSIIEQTWNNIELILVNDGSTDDTRLHISAWEPKFKDRGYSVVIIDQNNQGLPAAVRNGFARATGDFLCTVDCDDLLDPTYVSSPVEWLQKHPEYDFVTSEIEKIEYINGRKLMSPYLNSSCFNTPFTIENVLLRKTFINVVTLMIRKEYFYQCEVLRNYCTEPRQTQEPSLLLSLSAGKGKKGHIPKRLYFRRIDSRDLSCPSSYENAVQILNDWHSLAMQTLKRLNPTSDQQRLEQIAVFTHQKALYNCAVRYSKEQVANHILKDIVGTVNRIFYPSPKVTSSDITSIGIEVLFAAVTISITQSSPPEIQRSPGQRIIACGVLGKRGKYLLPLLAKTGIKPDILLDSNPGAMHDVDGSPVFLMETFEFQKNDFALILPAAPAPSEQIRKFLDLHSIVAYLSSHEIVDFLARVFFPLICQGTFGVGGYNSDSATESQHGYNVLQ